MSMPTTAEVRERFIDGFPFDTWAVARATLGDEFDRWLSAHDEAVRQEERERCAQIADRMHGVGNDIVARRIREQGKGQGS